MQKSKVYKLSFAIIYGLYVQKIEKKGRSKTDLNTLICWLTGHDTESLNVQIEQGVDLETFFNNAPCMNPNRAKITGSICGYRVEEMEDYLMQQIRYLDKLVDELAKGKPMHTILRS